MLSWNPSDKLSAFVCPEIDFLYNRFCLNVWCDNASHPGLKISVLLDNTLYPGCNIFVYIADQKQPNTSRARMDCGKLTLFLLLQT